MPLQLIQGAAAPVLLFDDVKGLLRADAAHQATIVELISRATSIVENYCERALINQTWELSFHDHFPCFPRRRNTSEIQLPLGRVSSVESVKYCDIDNVEQTLPAEDYEVNLLSEPATIRPAEGKSWPATSFIYQAVKIRFVAGYGASGDAVPGLVKAAITALVADMFENPHTRFLAASGAHEFRRQFSHAIEGMLFSFTAFLGDRG